VIERILSHPNDKALFADPVMLSEDTSPPQPWPGAPAFRLYPMTGLSALLLSLRKRRAFYWLDAGNCAARG
jgi:hypothetical protein